MPKFKTMSEVQRKQKSLKELYRLALHQLEINSLTIRTYQDVLKEVTILLEKTTDRIIIKKVIENAKERIILDAIIHNDWI